MELLGNVLTSRVNVASADNSKKANSRQLSEVASLSSLNTAWDVGF